VLDDVPGVNAVSPRAA